MRSQIVIDHDVRIFTRKGHNWTAKYRDLAGAAKRLDLESAIIDGEIVVLNEAGLSDYEALRTAITRRQHDLFSSPSTRSTSMGTTCETWTCRTGAKFLKT